MPYEVKEKRHSTHNRIGPRNSTNIPNIPNIEHFGFAAHSVVFNPDDSNIRHFVKLFLEGIVESVKF